MSRRCPGRSPVWVVFNWTFVRGCLRLLFRLLYRYRGFGAANVPAEGPLVFAANHQSHLDPVLVGVLVGDRPFASMARSGLFAFRPFGRLIRFLGAIPLRRGEGDRAAFKALVEELRAGRCVLVFPEGSRTRDGTVGLFKAGALRLARRGGAKVVPVAVDGAWEVWPRQRKLPRLRGRVAVRAGQALDIETLLAEGEPAGLELLRGRIEAMRQELSRERHERQAGA